MPMNNDHIYFCVNFYEILYVTSGHNNLPILQSHNVHENSTLVPIMISGIKLAKILVWSSSGSKGIGSSNPKLKVGSPGSPSGSTVILKACFLNFWGQQKIILNV